MNLQRVWAVVLRHLYHFRRNIDRLSDCIYWPVMDLLVWGLSTLWLQNSAAQQSNVLLGMLTAIVFWQIVWRANYEVSINFLEETWSQNVVNLFSTPLTVAEWVAGVMVTGLLKVVLAIFVGLGASWLFYSLNILTVGYLLVPFLASLVLFGWTLGFLGTGLIVRFGRQIQSVAWMIGFVFAPLSAVYYPVEALPHWLQPLAYALPTTYIFEGMRGILAGGCMPLGMLLASFVLNLLYLAGAMLFFVRMFEYRRSVGLAKIE